MVVTRYEQVDRALRSPHLRMPRGYRERNDPAGPPRFDPDGVLSRHRRLWLLFQSGEPHTRLRSLLAKVFTPRAVRALLPRIESLVDELLAPALERGSMEVIGERAYPLPAIVICELLGVPEADREMNRRWAVEVASTTEIFLSPEQIAAAERAATEWDAYLRALIAERRARPREALLDAMLAVDEGGSRFSDDEIVANVSLLFTAGHETTTGLIGNGLFALLRHPDQLARWRADPSIGERAVEELLRFDSPVQLSGRVSDEPIELEGVEVPPGLVVSLALGSANRDPRRFDRPDTLDLGRDAKPLSFGAGAHHCLGAALARSETKAALGALIGLTRSLELIEEPTWLPRLTLRGLASLAVSIERR